MPLTREQSIEIKQAVKEALITSLQDDAVISNLVDKVTQKINIQILVNKISCQEDRIRKLEEKVDDLEVKLESAEKLSRQKTVRIYGVPESTEEIIGNKVLDIFKSKMGLNILPREVDKCHRIGSASNDWPRTVVVSFTGLENKNKVMKARNKLKGSRVFIAEDLTRSRHEVYKEAARILGRRNVYTLGGSVFYRSNGAKRELKHTRDIPSSLA